MTIFRLFEKSMINRFQSASFIRTAFPLAIFLPLLAGCGNMSDNNTAKQSNNDFPTQTRVEYVLQCMEKKGGQNYDTLYPCVCSIDKIAEKLTYDEFAEAQTFSYLRSTPGEKGAIFRDPPRAKELRDRLKEAVAFAEQSCFVKK